MKQKNYNKTDLAIIYRPKDLLTVSAFISYCELYGIRVAKDELEYFEQQEFLLPAVRVARGYVEYRKILNSEGEWVFVSPDAIEEQKPKEIDPKPYYISGGFSLLDENWLDYYIQNKMLLEPAKQEFRPWKSYGKYQSEFTANLDLFEDDYEPFYSKAQLYQLSFLAQNMQISFKNESLFANREEWIKNGDKVSSFMNDLVDRFIRPKMPEYSKLINLLTEIKALVIPIEKEAYRFYLQQISINKEENDKEALLDANSHKELLLKKVIPELKKLSDKHKLSLEHIGDLRLLLLKAGTFSLDSKSFYIRKKYLNKLSEEDLINAEEPYKDLSFLNLYLSLLGEPLMSTKQLLLDTKFPLCEICNSSFIRKRKSQITCASPTCRKEHNRRFKAEKRKINPKYGI